MRDPILLTPGPLTTTLATKTAMLNDWGSWDGEFNRLTADVCARLLALIESDEHVCVPLQGSGTFAVEAAIGTLVPREGKLLVLVNGAYGKRMARLTEIMGRQLTVLDFGETAAVDPVRVATKLAEDLAITHVGLIYCETSTGILNPLREVANVVAQAGRKLIIDAMSAFGALSLSARDITFDAVIASSNKCLEGVPGMGFVLARRDSLAAAAGNAHSLSLDLHDQWTYLAKTGQWRYTPPTHVVAALAAALDQYDADGGRPARLARYQANCDALLAGLRELGLASFLAPELQAPIIITVHAPQHANWQFTDFYERVKAEGFVLYPGKLTEVETFRVGCIGAIGQAEIRSAVAAIGRALKAMGIFN
jgi:2-aminoethylphosphonate-pyruvate transaminase